MLWLYLVSVTSNKDYMDRWQAAKTSVRVSIYTFNLSHDEEGGRLPRSAEWMNDRNKKGWLVGWVVVVVVEREGIKKGSSGVSWGFNELEAFIVRYWIPFQLHPLTALIYRVGFTTVLWHRRSCSIGYTGLIIKNTRTTNYWWQQKRKNIFL